MQFIVRTKYWQYNDAAEKNTPLLLGTLESLIVALESVSGAISKWFNDNQMQANACKCQVSIGTDQTVLVNVGTTQIDNSKSEKLLGLKLTIN